MDMNSKDYILSKMASGAGEADGSSLHNGPSWKPRRPGSVRRWLGDNLLLLITIVGVLLGVAVGFALRPLQLGDDAILLISYPGELVMRLLKLMILPLIIASLISGAARLNASMNGKIAVRTLVYFLLTSLLNAVLGTALVLLIHPGDPVARSVLPVGADDREVRILDSFLDLGRNVFTDNLFQAAFQQAHTVYIPRVVRFQANDSINDSSSALLEAVVAEPPHLVRAIRYREGTNTLGIIFFCLVFGTVLGTMGAKAQVVVEFFTIVDEVVMRIVTGVMWLTPIGISSVICGKILSVGDLALVVQQLGWFIFTVVLGVLIYQLVLLQLIYLAVVRRNPYRYYWGLVQATLTAFATASTAAALPVTFRCMDRKVNVDPRVSRFVLPVGCNINMDGTALFVAVASIFIAQMNEISLGVGEVLTVCLASTAASFSSASVPSAALVLIFMVLATIDAPTQDVSLLFAIDWFVDRVRTTNNMLGDCYAAAVVEHLSRDQLSASNTTIIQEHAGPLLPVHYDDPSRRNSDPDTVLVETIPSTTSITANGVVQKL
ncbi:excitatory amino acid transporter isoform X2 [Anabrus simplex]|uniref:excitatory amino acid transporter isoform X2 n=1 Tax=Anabrus simplex TaxID=316456 RepID=UPI0035A28267